MIYIYSKSSAEKSTEDVIDWLNFYEAEFERINGSDLVNNFSYRINNRHVGTENDIVWFRRWYDSGEITNKLMDVNLRNKNFANLFRNVSSELKIVSDFFWRKFKNCRWLTYPHELANDKLEVLEAATMCGLTIPDTIITTSKRDLIEFRKKSKRIISKLMSNAAPSYSLDEYFVALYTSEITDDILDSIPDNFFPSLFQELIRKQYEIRIFFLEGNLYPMAIFSQNDKQTQVDFRNYNHSKPNRNVPYKLPDEIESKIKLLIKKLKLTTGSIDIIKSQQEDYIFLEINPVGQFGMTSRPCNYYLEKEIAEYLIKANKN